MDLECADILYKAQKYSRALFHLQQANEKLAKALLLRVGWLTPSRSKEDNIYRINLGLHRKTPKDYSHYLLKNFVSDLEDIFSFLKSVFSRLKDRLTEDYKREYETFIRTSEASINKLRLVRSRLLDKEELKLELDGAQQLFDAITKLGKIFANALSRMDSSKIHRIVTKALRKPVPVEYVDYLIRQLEGVEAIIKSSLSVLVCVALSVVVEPLVFLTRYPDMPELKFDENNAYVQLFPKIFTLISQIVEHAA